MTNYNYDYYFSIFGNWILIIIQRRNNPIPHGFDMIEIQINYRRLM